MMRIIKWRVWCKTRNPYMCYNVMVGNSNHYMILEKDGVKYYTLANDNAVLMQFTGLHDKNGKEIYEGDIVEIDNYLYKICFINGSYTLISISNDDIFYHHEDLLGSLNLNCKIIGNIYENPELL